MQRKIVLLLVLSSIALFISSLFFPVFQCRQGTNWEGHEVLLLGWIGLLVLDPRWMINIMFFLVSLWQFSPEPSQNTKKTLFATLMIIGSLSATFIPAMGCSEGPGAPGLSIGLTTGGYLWVIAMVLSGVSVFVESGFPNPTVKRDAP